MLWGLPGLVLEPGAGVVAAKEEATCVAVGKALCMLHSAEHATLALAVTLALALALALALCLV